MYWRTTLMGAPPQEAAKYDGDHSTPDQYRWARSGLDFLSSLEDTPLRLLTKLETATFGGYSISRCT